LWQARIGKGASPSISSRYVVHVYANRRKSADNVVSCTPRATTFHHHCYRNVRFGLAVQKRGQKNSLQFREPIRVIGDLLKFTYATNPGAAFNFATNATVVLSSLKLCVAAFILYYMSKPIHPQWAVGFSLLFGGVVGNLCDRATPRTREMARRSDRLDPNSALASLQYRRLSHCLRWDFS
jgi:hypothetical protein